MTTEPLDGKGLAGLRALVKSEWHIHQSDAEDLLALVDELRAALKHFAKDTEPAYANCDECAAVTELLARIAPPPEPPNE